MPVTSTAWSPQQVAALEVIRTWLASPGGKPVLRIFGYAGTGKTTMIKELTSGSAVLTYTGKASQVLRSKGIPASTIHSTIYRSAAESSEELARLRAELRTAPQEERARLQAKIEALVESLKNPHFSLREDAFEEDRPKVIIIDECSMLDTKIAEDLMRFGIPIMVFGDPGQLPPVSGGKGYFIGEEPDIMLTEIHRQAEGNPVIQLATRAREGQPITTGSYGECRVTRQWPDRWWEDYDQVLVGRVKEKDARNRRARRALGFDGVVPMPGERLICLRNDHKLGLLNGSQWVVEKCDAVPGLSNMVSLLDLTVKSLDGSREVHCTAWRDVFEVGEQEFKKQYTFYERMAAQEFDFSYAITVHKAQGSEWDRVLVLDESYLWQRDGTNKNWLYTAITRAAKSVTVIR